MPAGGPGRDAAAAAAAAIGSAIMANCIEIPGGDIAGLLAGAG